MAEIIEVTLKVNVGKTLAESGQKAKSTFQAINLEYLGSRLK